MNQKYLYLLLNIGTFIVPFIFSFYPKANFSAKWKYVLPSIVANATIFMIWDDIFTRMGVWGFNEQYLTGIYIYHLPLEEVLFFFTIPYACIFTYFALTYLIEKDHLRGANELISSAIVIICLVVGLYNAERWYTLITFMALGLFLTYVMLKIRPRYMGRFYFSFGVILLPFLLVNGILTGSFIDEPVVWYNNDENLGLRVGTIPLEDFFYAMLMLLFPIAMAEKLEEIDYYKKKSPAKTGLFNIFR